jgi:hypothetical protein
LGIVRNDANLEQQSKEIEVVPDPFNSIEGMSDGEIFEAYENTLAGNVPTVWREGASGKDLNRIVKVVVQGEIEKGKQQAVEMSDRLQEEARRNLREVVIPQIKKGMSLDDINRQVNAILAQHGHDLDALNQTYKQVVGQVLTTEFSEDNIVEALRSEAIFDEGGVFGSVKPGTLAEKRLAGQVQMKIFEMMRNHFPEVAQHMSMPDVKNDTPVATESKSQKRATRRVSERQSQDGKTNAGKLQRK